MGIVVVVGIIVAVALSTATPDFDTIIANRDCDAALKISEEQVSNAGVEQAFKMELFMTGCILSGGNMSPP